MERRDFLKLMLALPLVAGISFGPSASAQSWLNLFRLHPTRFIGGLIFNVARAVLIEIAGEALYERLVSNSYNSGNTENNPQVSYYSNYKAIPESEPTFNHKEYKAAIIVAGIADYAIYKRELKLKLVSSADRERFSNLRDYLADNSDEIRVKATNYEFSKPVTRDTPVDDLLSIDWFTLNDESKKAQYYASMIDITGATIFKEWALS